MMDLEEFQSWDILMNTTAKAEYMTAIVAAKEGICVKQFIKNSPCCLVFSPAFRIHSKRVEEP